VRIGVWDEAELIGGYALPFVPADSVVEIDGMAREVRTEFDGQVNTHNGFAGGYSGGPVSWLSMKNGKPYTVTVDTETEAGGDLMVDLLTNEMGAL